MFRLLHCFALTLVLASGALCAAEAPTARLQIIVDDSFEGEVGRSIARYYADRAAWSVEVVPVAKLPATGRDRLQAAFPLFLVTPAGEGASSAHSGLADCFRFLEAAATRFPRNMAGDGARQVP